MQVNWPIRIVFMFLLTVTLSACQSTGTPWKSSSYSKPAAQPPSVLSQSIPKRQTQIDRTGQSYDYNVANARQQQQTINTQAQQGYYGTIEPSRPDYYEEVKRQQALAQQQAAQNSVDQTGAYATQNTNYEQVPLQNAIRKSKIALLLPLTGDHSSIGESLLQASQMALFDLGAQELELMPKDTKGSVEGARVAAQQAVRDGADLVLGPVFSGSVKAVKPILSRANINMVAFSTDWANAGGNTYIMGVLPFTQIERITDYMSAQGYYKYGLIAPRTQYGNVVSDSFKARVKQNGGDLVREERYSPLDPNISPLVRSFADYDTRVTIKEERVRELEEKLALNPNDEIAQKELESLENIQTMGELPFEVVMVPVGGKEARTMVNLLRFYDVDATDVQLIGTGLWDDPGLAKEPAMDGAYFASPSPRARSVFEQKYEDTYGIKPPRIASLAYDATALSVVLGRSVYSSNKFSRQALTNPNGFAGVDGIFRLNQNGLAQRGLAVLQIRNGNIEVIEPAPTTFQVFNQN